MPACSVSYFLCCTRATKEIGDVCTQATSYRDHRESNKGSKERQGPILGVRFTEVSVKRESTELIVLYCSTGIRFSFLIVSPYYSSLPEFVFNLHFLMISATVFENFEKKTEKQQ